MTKLYKHSKIAKRIIYKIRHHKGHGIHSPFVFRFINDVVEEKLTYYCFIDIRKHLKQFKSHSFDIRKEYLLCFRIVNYFNVQTVLELGSGKGVNTLFLLAPSSKIKCYCFESDNKNIQMAHKIQGHISHRISFLKNIEDIVPLGGVDCIFIDLNKLTNEQACLVATNLQLMPLPRFIFVRGIRNNRLNQTFWKELANHPNRTASLDLFHIGILFFNKQLSRWNYQISF